MGSRTTPHQESWWMRSRKFCFFAGLPTFEIRTQDEKFSADLDNPDALFLNDSAKMPHGKTSEFRRIRNVQECPLRRTFIGRLHTRPPLRRTNMQSECHSTLRP